MDRFAPLTADDQQRLSVWKWRYAVQHDAGLTRKEAAHIAFLRLLVENGLFADDRAPAEEQS